MSGWVIALVVCGVLFDLWSARRERLDMAKQLRELDRKSREILRHLRD